MKHFLLPITIVHIIIQRLLISRFNNLAASIQQIFMVLSYFGVIRILKRLLIILFSSSMYHLIFEDTSKEWMVGEKAISSWIYLYLFFPFFDFLIFFPFIWISHFLCPLHSILFAFLTFYSGFHLAFRNRSSAYDNTTGTYILLSSILKLCLLIMICFNNSLINFEVTELFEIKLSPLFYQKNWIQSWFSETITFEPLYLICLVVLSSPIIFRLSSEVIYQINRYHD